VASPDSSAGPLGPANGTQVLEDLRYASCVDGTRPRVPLVAMLLAPVGVGGRTPTIGTSIAPLMICRWGACFAQSHALDSRLKISGMTEGRRLPVAGRRPCPPANVGVRGRTPSTGISIAPLMICRWGACSPQGGRRMLGQEGEIRIQKRYFYSGNVKKDKSL
jgi:hypothetical protein